MQDDALKEGEDEGARSGKPHHWKMTDLVEFARRKVAKARAYKRYQDAKKA